jgi:hypothetical protein
MSFLLWAYWIGAALTVLGIFCASCDETLESVFSDAPAFLVMILGWPLLWIFGAIFVAKNWRG